MADGAGEADDNDELDDDEDDEEDLAEILRDHADPDARQAVADVLGGRWESVESDVALREALNDPEALVRAAAATALGQRGDTEAVDGLYSALRDPDPRVRVAAMEAVRQLAPNRSLGRVRRLLKDPDADVRRVAQATVEILEGRRRPLQIPEWAELPPRRVVEGRKSMKIADPLFKSLWARLRGKGLTYANTEFRRCELKSIVGVRTREPRLRPLIRNVHLVNCVLYATSTGPVVMEDVLIENCDTARSVLIYGAALKHVVLRGRIGTISLKCASNRRSPAVWHAANDAYYANVDWALGLRAAEVSNLELHGVPARLVRRDPVSQVVITRAKALAGGWQEIVGRSGWDISIRWFLDDPLEQDLILVTPAGAALPRGSAHAAALARSGCGGA